jgi:hypothetical protein
MGGRPKTLKQWRVLPHEAFFKLSTTEKIEYLNAAVEQCGYRVEFKSPRAKRKRGDGFE